MTLNKLFLLFAIIYYTIFVLDFIFDYDNFTYIWLVTGQLFLELKNYIENA